MATFLSSVLGLRLPRCLGDGRIIAKAGTFANMPVGSLHRFKNNTDKLARMDGKFVGLVAVSDPIKASTPEAVRALHDLGLRIIMLTGDNEKTARVVAEKLGIDEFHAGVRPEDKHERVKSLKAEARKVAMAGDGINDAPALAEADVGIAMGMADR